MTVLDPSCPNLLATVISWHTQELPEVRAVTKNPATGQFKQAMPLVRFRPSPGGTSTWAGDTTTLLDVDWYDTSDDVLWASVRATTTVLERLAARHHAGLLVDDCAVHMVPGAAPYEDESVVRAFGVFRVTTRS
ncbi:hypothetical protein KGD82_16325 [Nocardiopsis eucommiae]|uniref:Uncharacterized protein n=1 Tax=Nocardiopsis eucommiae TaxID=2831970 RepID=A0A975L852_9ACTN|nr:hypothetical protein KGD82_16325 [Nocardiopsis eucommiae]